MSTGTHRGKIIHLATDHAGFELKESIRTWLHNEGCNVVDHGAKQHDPLDDFPDFIGKAVTQVAKLPNDAVGIVFGGSGQGEAMVANRFPGVRATVFYGGDKNILELSRSHNDANVLSVGARFVSEQEAKEAITLWIDTSFSREEKRVRRNRKLEQVTNRTA